MLIDRFPRPLYAPETEASTGGDTGGAPPGGGASGDTGGDTGGARKSLRESLADNFKAARDAEAEGERTDDRRAQRRTRADTTDKTKEAEGAKEGDAKPAEGDAAAAAAKAAADAAAAAATQTVGEAPTAWSKEAKAEWAKVPAEVQRAIIKREGDVQKGVEALKQHYGAIEASYAPFGETMKRLNLTPAQSIERLFQWFAALQKTPKEAFPALAKSFGYKLEDMVTAPAAAGGATQTEAEKAAAAAAAGANGSLTMEQVDRLVAEKLQQAMGVFGQKIGSLESGYAQVSQAKTEEILANWAKGKDHFEEVRQLMAKLIENGTVPLTAEGRVDLDGAYNMAIWAHEGVRAKVRAAEEAKVKADAKAKADADAKAAAEKATAARRAATSVSGGAPGASNTTDATKKPKKGSSVRESLMATIDELRA